MTNYYSYSRNLNSVISTLNTTYLIFVSRIGSGYVSLDISKGDLRAYKDKITEQEYNSVLNERITEILNKIEGGLFLLSKTHCLVLTNEQKNIVIIFRPHSDCILQIENRMEISEDIIKYFDCSKLTTPLLDLLNNLKEQSEFK
jgi:hypothetical protein